MQLPDNMLQRILLLLLLSLPIAASAQQTWDSGGAPGYKFTFGPQRSGSESFHDVITGKTIVVPTYSRPMPVSVNGDQVFHPEFPLIPDVLIEDKVLSNLESALDLTSIPDGPLEMHLYRVVVDKTGKVVYTDFSGVASTGSAFSRNIGGNPQKLFANISGLPIASPNGNKTPYLQPLFFNRFKIMVTAHHIRYWLDDGVKR
jgi:hypothetical protein